MHRSPCAAWTGPEITAFSGLVNRVENWWYARQVPKGDAPLKSDLPAVFSRQASPATTAQVATAQSAKRPATTERATTASASKLMATVVPIATVPSAVVPATTPTTTPTTTVPIKASAQRESVVPALPRWTDVPGLVSDVGSMAVSSVAPDAIHPAVIATVVRLDTTKVKLVYVPGVREPGAGPWAWKSRIPIAERGALVAAFNAGFRFRDTPGGLFTEGRNAVRPLTDGIASLVISKDGAVDVGVWGRDVQMGPDVLSVRQNLHLIVDSGVPVPGLQTNTDGLWGNRKSQLQYTWRSGIASMQMDGSCTRRDANSVSPH